MFYKYIKFFIGTNYEIYCETGVNQGDNNFIPEKLQTFDIDQNSLLYYDEIDLVINTPLGKQARYDEESIGKACIQNGIVSITTLSGANAAVRAIRRSRDKIIVKPIQEYYK